jgi:hypothetical protein
VKGGWAEREREGEEVWRVIEMHDGGGDGVGDMWKALERDTEYGSGRGVFQLNFRCVERHSTLT